ncbi:MULTISPECIES: hypothetical protein [unclassified Pseudoclavibacter]|uniref:hypothetical protein n=1 Tax=unclassified Pseudoclavibacter TaxID=2615177 RepID=UPI001BAC9FF5|nr:hypothetical protein [Pseudoclavibacter sp. Marseille-Q4354]MBS3177725.1 hypothetical protein [Pseudoclavibacter sp. Marseille-Q4354]
MSGKSQCSRRDCAAPVVGRRLCRKHYQQAWVRGDFDNEPLPPKREGATVCPQDHKHAETGTCYVFHKCRCTPCREGRARAEQRRRKAKAYGRFDTGLVDVEPVREHMLALSELGVGYKRVAELAGLGITPVRNIIFGRQDPGPRKGEMLKHVKRETAEAILAVTADASALAGGASMSSLGARRRVQALVARGWTLSKLGKQLGETPTNFITSLGRASITVRRHKAIADLYEQLWNVAPPAELWHDKTARTRALNYAAARRWLPPMAWDDIDTDPEPPVAEADDDAVDHAVITLALAGDSVRLSSSERRECVRILTDREWSAQRIADQLQCTPRTVVRIRGELTNSASKTTQAA